MNLLSKLEGKRTYIVAAVVAVLNLAVAMNWVSPAHLAQVNTVLGALGLAALRASVK
jgi:hypothetical protein